MRDLPATMTGLRFSIIGAYLRFADGITAEALKEGAFFDLTYANLRQPGFNPHSNFAFLRYKDDDVLLIVVNFSRDAEHVNVVIPDLAFDMAKIERGEIVSADLLWGKPHKLNLSSTSPLSVYMSAGDALVLPIGKRKGGSDHKMRGSALRGEKKS